MSALAHVGAGFIAGILFTIGYFCWRIMRAQGSDRSNMVNPLRALAHVIMHPGDLAAMVYIVKSDGLLEKYPHDALKVGWAFHRPFYYLGMDELSQVVKTRKPLS